MTCVLGYSGGTAGTACLMSGGRILSWAASERGAPGSATISACLDAADAGWRDVDMVVDCGVEAFPLHPWDPLTGVPHGVPRVTVSRHDALAHAAAASSAFGDGVVAVVSCHGTERYEREAGLRYESDSLYELVDRRLSLRLRHSASAGRSTLATALDFRRHVCRYVFGAAAEDLAPADGLAALASSGRPGRWSDAAALRCEAGRVGVESSALGHLAPERARSALADPTANDLAFHADVAHWAQTLIEAAVLGQLTDWYRELPRARLIYTGGLAFDGTLNRRVGADTPFGRVHVHGAADARSAAIGCCLHGLTRLTDRAVPFVGGGPVGRTAAGPAGSE
ncbi:hypothetical protein ACFU5P_09825 [Streptomyces sp. NPDC057433]|uniref:hypothetical protein n=1 Tax=Streptomyces sp. NPDC057433 TaxID=3346132 RepID=UPI00368FCADB